MKVLIIGATGPTGRELTTQALDEGHDVRLFVRNRAAVSIWSPRLDVVEGDILDWKTVRPAMLGMNAVLSALGTGNDLRKTTLFSDGAKAILWAMAEANVRRFVCVTSSGTIEDSKEPIYVRLIGRRILRHVLEDQRRAEECIRASNAAWTIVRPPRLVNGPKRSRYEMESEKPAGATYEISRADVAEFMVREMVAKKFVQQAVGIGYP
jgi:putative NADH-flavin reductase